MSYSDNLAYQEEPREELINGEIVAMSPRPAFNHNQVSSNIYRIFANYLHGRKCTAIADGTDLYLTETERFIPDMMVVCSRDKIKWNGVHGAPDLVVEVLSPGTAKNDKKHKKDVYASCGVLEYWIVSTGERSIEQYILQDGCLELSAVYTLHPDYMLEAMTEEEKSSLISEFKCTIFDELSIPLSDIFSGLLE